MLLDANFLKTVKPAIIRAWELIGQDVDDCEITNVAAIECVIDAGRMFAYGSGEADTLISKGIEEHGYDTVVAYLSDNIYLGL